jgi:phosphoribosylaminoimidazolecarboxamide formyltransferase / IMP cyclohydrolase
MSRRKRSKRRALVSVSDKKGLVPFAEELVALSFELVSTGGTAALLREAKVPVTDVATVTGFPEIMDGRVKTLHPAVHGGLLARQDIDDAERIAHGIELIDLLVVNLYPFSQVAANPKSAESDAIEMIDVGGPAMLRAAAKNHARVSVVVDVTDYERILEYYRAGEPPAEFKRHLAAKAFAHTAAYDAEISSYLRSRLDSNAPYPERLALGWQRKTLLRYGENPHQSAALYVNGAAPAGSVAAATQLQGKALSYNNLVDSDTALQCVRSFEEAACVIVKHANPCGVAASNDLATAYEKAYACDPTSAFGGVIAFNGDVDVGTAEAILDNQFAEVIVAPRVADPARDVFARKPNMRVLECGAAAGDRAECDLKSLEGGLLVQERDSADLIEADLKVVTRRQPNAAEMRDLRFAWRVVRFVKSNAIVFARDGATLGIGAGQMSRIMSVRIAALQAAQRDFGLTGAAMASDAFFPFRDGIDVAAENGIGAVIQPGGSMRDDEVIAAADAHGIAMVFTGMRHFRH